eukprot:TRINITY_DN1560_c0_g2_i1.p1 TRINITY_DN1560_c0_g2~~TRINITY_DN1560_c0_g2_i1.p1  ORF type:complete len:301 (+),score=58.51 TRINITY_DN1560_c0_g2_i1:138-1040(+)
MERTFDRKTIVSMIAVASACVLTYSVVSWFRSGKVEERSKEKKRSHTTTRRRRRADSDEEEDRRDFSDVDPSLRHDRPRTEATARNLSDIHLPGLNNSYFRAMETPYHFEVRRGRIDRRDLLFALNLIRRLSEKYLTKMRKDFRTQRRKNYQDLEIYRQLISEFSEQTEFLLSETSTKAFNDCGITQEIFEASLAVYQSEEQVSAAVNSLGVAKKTLPLKDVSKVRLREILEFSAKKRDEIMSTAPLDAAADVGFLHTRLEDEVYKRYQLEPEEIAALFEKYECDTDPEFRGYLETFGRR